MLFCVDWATGSCAARLWEKTHVPAEPSRAPVGPILSTGLARTRLGQLPSAQLVLMGLVGRVVGGLRDLISGAPNADPSGENSSRRRGRGAMDPPTFRSPEIAESHPSV